MLNRELERAAAGISLERSLQAKWAPFINGSTGRNGPTQLRGYLEENVAAPV
jgi:hypothetical protein